MYRPHTVFIALLLFAASAVPGSTALAQVVAAPYYGPEAFIGALSTHQQLPLARQFAETSAALAGQLTTACADGSRDAADRTATRAAWLAAAQAWERLDTVAVGATVSRRSARAIDFRPARPRLILAAIKTRAVDTVPPDAAALERIGAPAKGLPALEWLLWDPAAPNDAAACRYAIGIADGVVREARALVDGHATDAAHDWVEDGEGAAVRASESVNQWLAGLEALRWRQLGKPLAVVDTTGAGTIDPHRDIWPRPPSASHRAAWRDRWTTLRDIAVGAAPTDGFGPQAAVPPAVVSLEALLRGRGHNAEADGWTAVIGKADQAMQTLTSSDAALPPNVVMREALAALGAVKQFMQQRLAPTLKVALGFSDADGD